MEFLNLGNLVQTTGNRKLFPVVRPPRGGAYRLLTGGYMDSLPVKRSMDLQKFLGVLPNYLSTIQSMSRNYPLDFDEVVVQILQDLDMVRTWGSNIRTEQLLRNPMSPKARVYALKDRIVMCDFSDTAKLAYVLLCFFYDEYPQVGREAHTKTMLGREYPTEGLLSMLEGKVIPEPADSDSGTIRMQHTPRPRASTRMWRGLEVPDVSGSYPPEPVGPSGRSREIDMSFLDELRVASYGGPIAHEGVATQEASDEAESTEES